MAALVQLEKAGRNFPKGSVEALRDISMTVNRGDSIAITGPSGSGKSTLLQILGAMDRPTSGRVSFDGDQPQVPADWVRVRARLVGFVFQAFHLLPNLTAVENVQVPMFGVVPGRREREQRAFELLERVDLDSRAHHLPAELSGGEQQRVAIARGLANDPPLLLADEPTGNLDSKNTAEVLDLLLQLHRDRDSALVLVTHEPTIAERLEDTVRLLDGRIQS